LLVLFFNEVIKGEPFLIDSLLGFGTIERFFLFRVKTWVSGLLLSINCVCLFVVICCVFGLFWGEARKALWFRWSDLGDKIS